MFWLGAILNMSENIKLSNTNCCVPQCTSRASKDPQISFHKFPVEGDKTIIINGQNARVTVERRKEWLRRLRIGKKVSTRMLVCSKHFRKDDFFSGPGREGKVRLRPRLKKTAVPTLCLPVSSTERKEALERKQKAAQDRPKQNKNANNLKKKPGGKRKKMQSKEITSDEVGYSPVKCLSNQTSSCFNLDEKDKSECIPAVSVKVEDPWEKESIFTPKPVGDNSQVCDKLQIKIKEVRSVSNSFSAEGADEYKTEISETSSHFARPLKVLKREKIFGALVASELSDLSVNPELYLKTKRAILDILNQARFELINCDS